MSAFKDLRVLELTTGVAGPAAGSFFSDFGADVIKVEPTGGDEMRSTASFVAWNRGKRGAEADTGRAADVTKIGDLIRECDLVIVHRRDDLSTWEVSVEDLGNADRGPVILELPAFDGVPPWFGGRESQALLAAVSGYSRRQSSFDGGPVDMVYPHLLYVQGLLGATAAAAALIERMKSGRGQVVTVDGLHAVAEMFTGNYSLDPQGEVLDTAIGPRGLNPTYSHYQTADGCWILLGGLVPKFQERILRMLGEGWIIDDPRIAGDFDALFSSENRDWVREVISDRLLTKPRSEWLEIFKQGGVPVAPLNEPHEAFTHAHTRELGIPVVVDDHDFGEVTIVGQPIRASLTPAEIISGSPRRSGAVAALEWGSRDQPLAGIGWQGQSGGKVNSSGPLSGVRVLLLGSFVAGPFGAFLLGHMGADVIKIESPEGDPWRERGFYYSDGMRSITIDLKSQAGHDVFRRLAADADVIVDNLRPGVGATLGVDYEHVVAENPDVVTVSLTGFGDEGPLASEPGFDPVLQAWSGMCVAQGGDDVPVLYTVPVNDVSAASLIAFAACAGLFHRFRTGNGQALSTSLVAASMYMQSGELVTGDFPSLLRRGGRDYRGPNELDRYYRTQDDWIRIEALPETTVEELREAVDAGADDLEVAFARMATHTVLERMLAAGIPAVRARTVRDVVLSGDHAARFVHRRPGGEHTYYRPSQYVAFSRTSYAQDLYPPGAGEHTRQILEEVGFTPAEQAQLGETRAVSFGEPMSPRILNPYR